MAFESNGFMQQAIPFFDGHFDHWSMLMEKILRSKVFWDIVENGVTEPTEGEKLTKAKSKALED